MQLVNASDMEHINPTIFLYLALWIVECWPVTYNSNMLWSVSLNFRL